MSLAVVGATYPTARARSRRGEIAICQPGEPIEFRRERAGRDGRRSVGVYSARGVQIGYVHADGADRIAAQIAVARGVFQGADTFGAIIYATFDGSTPTLPLSRNRARKIVRPPAEPVDEFCDILPAGRGADLDQSPAWRSGFITSATAS